jgi:hypothetical protein
VHPLYGTQRARRGPTTTTPYLGEKRLRFSETSINTRTPHSQRGRSVGPVVLLRRVLAVACSFGWWLMTVAGLF